MPYLGGVELIRTLRAEHNDALVVFFSGYDDSSYIRSALRLGAADYLLKPIKPNELNECLQKCVEALNLAARGKNADGAVLSAAPRIHRRGVGKAVLRALRGTAPCAAVRRRIGGKEKALRHPSAPFGE
jgi:YesN/AraC family two-component response regulator